MNPRMLLRQLAGFSMLKMIIYYEIPSNNIIMACAPTCSFILRTIIIINVENSKLTINSNNNNW